LWATALLAASVNSIASTTPAQKRRMCHLPLGQCRKM
jgi:hypothetical protein